MKVKELIDVLESFDPEATVLTYDWDGDDYSQWGTRVFQNKEGICIGQSTDG